MAPTKVATPWQLRRVYASIFLSITTSTAALQAEPVLMAQLVGGDVARSAIMLSSTSTISGLLGLLVNQVGGRLSDKVGRKALFLAGPAFSLVQGLAIFLQPASLPLLMVCRTLRLCLGTFSSSVMCMAALSDLAEGKQLSVANSVLWACSGLGVIVGPLLEGSILARGLPVRFSYLLAAIVSSIHVLFTGFVLRETLPPGEGKPFTMAGFNPLGFVKLFRRSTPATLQKLVVVGSLQSWLEGKNGVDYVQIWQREHLKWNVFQMRNFTVSYGVCMFVAGQFLTPGLLKAMSARTFTGFTNLTNLLGFFMRGWSENPKIFWAAIVPMLPGVNGSSASAIKAIASDHARAAGLGAGEYSGYFNNLRALVGAASTMTFGVSYSFCVRRGLHPGIPFWLGAILGAAVPELLHRTMSTEEMRRHSAV